MLPEWMDANKMRHFDETMILDNSIALSVIGTEIWIFSPSSLHIIS